MTLYKVPTLSVCEDMEARSASGENRIIPLNAFPVYLVKSETEWWNMHVSSAKVEKMSMGELYEGRLVTRKGEFWIVTNHTRRGFSSFDTFVKMGFESDMAFPLTLAEVRSLPEGNRLPVLGDGTLGLGNSHNSLMLQKMLGKGRRRRGRGQEGYV